MKFFSLIMLLTTLSGHVQGQELNLSCFNKIGDESLTIVERAENGIEAKLFAYDGQNRAPTLVSTFSGQSSQSDNENEIHLFSNKQYQLTDSEGLEAQLTIVTRPIIGRGGFGRAGCGRVQCQPTISAYLNYKQETSLYECF